MSSIINVEVDLEEYRDDIEDFLNDGIKSDLQEYVDEMEKNLYVYSTKSFKSYEEIYRDLKMIIKEN